MHQANRWPAGIVRAIGRQRPHAVILVPAGGLDAPCRKLVKPSFPLAAAIGREPVFIDRDQHNRGTERQPNLGPQAFAEEGLGERAR